MVHFRGTFDARNGVAFEQETEDHFGLFDWQVHAVQMILAWLQKYLGALAALIALVTLAVAPIALTVGVAVVASHCDSPRGKSQPKSA